MERLRNLEPFLSGSIIGQREVIPRVASLLLHGEMGLTSPDRPKASFLFLGPTGVGKTEIAAQFTAYLMGREKFCRLDMSEYQTQESLGLLLGHRPPERGRLGQFFDATGGHGTLLFDEIEKAHPRVLDIFLQILDAARITLADGHTLDLSRFYVVCTSNIGSARIMQLHKSPYSTLARIVHSEAQRALRPEIFARINETLVFNRLSYDDQVTICRLMTEKEIQMQDARGHRLALSPGVHEFLVSKGYHPRLGARPMRSAVSRLVRDAIASALLAGQPSSGLLQVDSVADRLRISPQPPTLSLQPS